MLMELQTPIDLDTVFGYGWLMGTIETVQIKASCGDSPMPRLHIMTANNPEAYHSSQST